MKILSIGNFGHGWDGSICDEEHIAKALEDLGHDVARVQRDNAYEDIVKNWGNPLFDFVLLAQWDGYTEELLKMLPHPRVYWAFDYQAEGQAWHERLIKTSDLYLSKRIADSKYENWQWLSQDFAPNFLNEYPGDVEKDIEVLFTGSYLPWATERNETLKAIDEEFDLHIYSVTANEWVAQGFKNVHGPKMDDELPYLYARAKVNISIDHTIEAGYWSDRNAQIMACGGFVLFKYVPLSTATFSHYVDYFHDAADCIDKIHFYLKNGGLRATRARWGYDYAQMHLTVDERVSDLVTIVEGIL